MKTYEIKKEPIKSEGKTIDKWNIYYYDDCGIQETKEFWSYIGENEPIEGQQIKTGYSKK